MNLLVFLHFFALIIYVFLALFIYLQNRKSLLNIYCIAILVCLSFWSFGMIFHHNPATSLKTVRLMENFSSFGWIGLFGFFFLFILLFTEQKKILQSRLFHIFNFSLPAFFIYLQWTGSLVVNFSPQSYGWNFAWTPSLWTYLFFTYCYSISLISVYLLVKYIRASAKPVPVKQAKIILMTIAATIILSSLTEIIFPTLGFYSIPNMGDVFSLIWVAGLVYVITKYQFFTLTPFSAAEEIISTMSDSLLLLDSSGKIKDINFATTRLLNYEKNELKGKHITFIMPEENPKNFELLQRCKTENIKHVVTTLTSKEGELIPVSFSSSIMTDPEGTTRGIICIARDMIRQEEAESAVRESEQRYHSLYKKTPAMLMSMDKDLRILNVSDYWCVALGYGRSEISGKKITQLMTDESKNKLQHHYLPGLIENGFLDDAPLQLMKKNGEIIDVLLSTVAERNDKGKLVRTLTVLVDVTERMKTETELRKLSQAVEQSPTLIIITDASGNIEYVNPKFSQVTGYSREDVIGKNPRMLKSGDKSPEEYKKMWEMITSHGEWRGEFHNKKKNGEPYWTSASISPITNEKGEITHYIALEEDITERKKVEEEIKSLARFPGENPQPVLRVSKHGEVIYANKASRVLEECYGGKKGNYLNDELRKIIGEVSRSGRNKVWEHECDNRTFLLMFSPIHEGGYINIYGSEITRLKKVEQSLRTSEEKYRNLIENIQDGVFIIQDNKMQFVNEAFAAMVGYRVDEIIKMDFKDLIAPEDLSMVTERYQRRQAGDNVPPEYEFRMLHKDGKKRIIVNMNVGLINYNGKTASMGTVKDVTEKKLAEDKLLQSEEKYRTLFEESRDAIFISTPEGKFLDINPAGVALFGYSSKQDFINEVNARDLYGQSEDREKFQQLIEEHGFVKDFKLELKRRDGDKITVLETSTAERDEKGNIILYRGIIRDITQEEILERQLQQAQKMEAIGTLAGGIAHDFNNLLTAINGFSEISLLKMKKDDPHRQNLAAILKSGKRASNLTRQLLAFSRRQVIEPKIVDINFLISDLQTMLHRLIGEDIIIEMNLSETIGQIKADPGQIEQILVNLIINARDALNETNRQSEKIISIETSSTVIDELYTRRHPEAIQGSYVLIAISDNGIGMKEEMKEKIFEPFFTTKAREKGTGLGLSTVYGIVKQNNASIYVYSEVGRGTTFKIYWPLAEQEIIPEALKEKSEEISGGNEKILFVEDADEVRMFASSALKSLGYLVYEASNGAEALELVKADALKPDLLIADVIMPEIGGKELAEKILKIDPAVKILFTSGYTDSHIVHGGFLQKGINYLQKPYSISALAQKVRTVLESEKKMV